MAHAIPTPGWWVTHLDDSVDACPSAVHAHDEDAAMVHAAIILGRHHRAEVVVMSGLADGPVRRLRGIPHPT